MLKKANDKIQHVYDLLEQMGKWWEGILIWSFFTVFVFGVLILTGTITSGFHLVDDWQYAKYVDMMKTQGFLECLRVTFNADIMLRYRPLYCVNRVLTAAAFGINLTAMSIMNAVEIIVTMGCLYYIARHMGCNVVYAALFALTVMVGYQSPVWWKLGPQESYGIMMFSAGFLLLLKWLRSGRRYQAVLSLAAFFLISLYKESFIMLLPFVMLYVVYDRMREQKVTVPNLWNAVKGKFIYLFVIFLIIAVNLILIVFVTGTHNFFGGGSGSTISLSNYYSAWNEAFHSDLKWYVRFCVLFIMILLTYWEQLKKLKWEMLLTLSIIGPQVIVYSKPAITERYILPAVLGFAFFFVIVCCNWKALSGKRRIVYMLGVLLMLAANGRAMLIEADYFAYRGNSVQTMLDTTLQYVQENDEVKVLSCLAPNVEGNLTMKYWMRLHGYEEMYYWQENELVISKEIEDDGRYTPLDVKFDEMDLVVMYNREDRHWCYEPSLDLSDFIEHKCGTLTIYFRR